MYYENLKKRLLIHLVLGIFIALLLSTFFILKNYEKAYKRMITNFNTILDKKENLKEDILLLDQMSSELDKLKTSSRSKNTEMLLERLEEIDSIDNDVKVMVGVLKEMESLINLPVTIAIKKDSYEALVKTINRLHFKKFPLLLINNLTIKSVPSMVECKIEGTIVIAKSEKEGNI